MQAGTGVRQRHFNYIRISHNIYYGTIGCMKPPEKLAFACTTVSQAAIGMDSTDFGEPTDRVIVFPAHGGLPCR